MAPAPPFNPPSADLPGKPFVPQWVPPAVTKEKENFATLQSIDLSSLDSEDPAVIDALIKQVKTAIRDDGFLFLENYGISLEQVRKDIRTRPNKQSLRSLLDKSFIVSSALRSIYTTT